jgi:hypothetical protein
LEGPLHEARGYPDYIALVRGSPGILHQARYIWVVHANAYIPQDIKRGFVDLFAVAALK